MRAHTAIMPKGIPTRGKLDFNRSPDTSDIRTHSKKMISTLSRELLKIRRNLMGIRDMIKPPDALVECVRRVARGEQSIEWDTLAKAFGRVSGREAATREVGHTLTPREIELVKMVAQGLRNRAIAERLAISEGTVKIHLHNIYEKLGIDGRLELMLWAQEQGVSGS